MEIGKCDQPGFYNEDEKLNQDVREIETGRRNERSREKCSEDSEDKWPKPLARIQKYSFLSSAMRRLFEKAVQKLMEACMGALHTSSQKG